MCARSPSMMQRKDGIRKSQQELPAGHCCPYLCCICEGETCWIAGSSSSSLWSRVATKRRDPSSAAISHHYFRRHRFQKMVVSFFARRGRRLSSGICHLVVLHVVEALLLGLFAAAAAAAATSVCSAREGVAGELMVLALLVRALSVRILDRIGPN